MRDALLPITALLFATALFLLGNGLQSTLVPLRADLDGFSEWAVGALTSAHNIGFVLGSLAAPLLFRRVGHIRVFAALSAFSVAAMLAHPAWVSPAPWFVLRFLIGFFAAGLYMVLESWLNDRATNENRGRVFSAYIVVNFAALTAGQWLLPLGEPSGAELFSLVAAMFALALAPVALTTMAQPAPVQSVHVRIGRLLKKSPVGAGGVFAVGLGNSAFWALAPVFAQAQGLDTAGIALFMSMVIGGGALAQLPFGAMSDRVDRRLVIALASVLGASGGLLLTLAGTGARDVLLAAALLYGVAALPLYSLCVAHANDVAHRAEFVETSAGLLLLNGLGAIFGPLIAAALVSAAGMGWLFAYTAAVHVLLAVFALYRMTRKASPQDKEPFVATSEQRTPAPLDPRADPAGA